MTDPAEKNALVNFLGTMFGQAAALDKAIVNPSKDMRPTSDLFKPILAEVIQQPVAHQASPQQYVPPVAQSTDLPESLYSPSPLPDRNPLKDIITHSRDVDRVVKAINELNDTFKSIVKLVTKVLPKKSNGRKKAIHIQTPGIPEIPASDSQDQ